MFLCVKIITSNGLTIITHIMQIRIAAKLNLYHLYGEKTILKLQLLLLLFNL